MSLPKDTLEFIASHLPQNGAEKESQPEKPGQEYTIDELAQAANTTVRNIRAYQDKGLLPPPTLKGRKGFYNNNHLSRLRTVTNMLSRGYTVNSIKELLDALEQGIGLEELIGIETAISSPWTDEPSQVLSMEELQDLFGETLTPGAIQKGMALELFIPQADGKVKIPSMRILAAGAQLAATGIPLESLMHIVQLMRDNVENVANMLVKLVSEHVLEPYGEQSLPPKEEIPKIAELIWHLRPLAEMAVNSELARAMDKAANRFLADKLDEIMQQVNRQSEPPSS